MSHDDHNAAAGGEREREKEYPQAGLLVVAPGLPWLCTPTSRNLLVGVPYVFDSALACCSMPACTVSCDFERADHSFPCSLQVHIATVSMLAGKPGLPYLWLLLVDCRQTHLAHQSMVRKRLLLVRV